MGDEDERLVAVGTWLYDSSIECTVHLVQKNIAYGSGDHLDSVEVREDRDGTFYYLKFFSPTDPTNVVSWSGAFDSVELAKADAQRTCAGLDWS